MASFVSPTAILPIIFELYKEFVCFTADPHPNNIDIYLTLEVVIDPARGIIFLR
jgi:hypothetical protein